MNQAGMNAAARGRWAVAAMFLANGFVTGSWAPQIPLLLSRLSISESVLGLLILVFGMGALVAMPWCGWLMARHGSRQVLRLFAVLMCFGLPAVALTGSIWLMVPALLFLGGTIGAMDVAMNTNAVAVEKQLGRAIMSSSHGFWSLGGFFGGALGGVMIVYLRYIGHAIAAGVLALAIICLVWSSIANGDAPAATKSGGGGWPRDPIIYVIGVMALLAMIPEGAVLDWAALHLREALGGDVTISGFAFAAFSATMAGMRFIGDGVRNRFGAVTTLRVSTFVAALGLLAAGLATDVWLALAAFAFAGLGVANIVPIIFSAAGNRGGMAAGTGMSVVTTMGYSGILAAPSAIGLIGEHIGFGVVFAGLGVLLLLVCLMAPLARGADFVASRPTE